MIEGICPNCGLKQFGYGLLNPRYQTCPECRTALIITENGLPLGKGFSPFTAERLDKPSSSEHVSKEADI